ncbi:MAG: M3 family metallopeptidase [Cyclobacteriaceae bacterium]|nr:M3 family metallopeptidase [Cyclobacteriaceae bacterium]
MKRNLIYAVGLLFVFFNACGPAEKDKKSMNPFFETYNTPFGVPPFDIIEVGHFKPAIDEGIRLHKEEIHAIAENQADPDFTNTLLALENAGELLSKVTTVFYNLNSANTNDQIQELAKEIAPELSNHNDDIRLNEKLFARVKRIWDTKETLGLNKEELKLLERNYKNFVRSGANLNEEDKDKLRKINQELSVLTVQFGQNVLAETNAYELVIEDEKDLAGLPDDLRDAASQVASQSGKEGKWVFNLQNPSVMPFLQYAESRDLRKAIWEAYQGRGNNDNADDNKEIIEKLVRLRMQKAQLLGYPTHAHYVLEETMAKNPETVYGFLNDLWTPALKVSKNEAQEMQKMISEDGYSFDLAPWDWRYYAEKIKREKYAFDEQEVKPYFSLDAVQEGVFMVTEKLFGLTFKKIDGIPAYHEEAEAYEVINADGQHQGVLYMDFHPRSSKRGGAWMTSYRRQKYENGVRVAPVISIVCNFARPTSNAPALLTFDETRTYFHEFGHALHGLLSDVTFESLAGTSVPRDFVELPSQIMENWAGDPEVMKMYAKHYKTGEVIPDELIEKIQSGNKFNQGFATVEYLAASFLDMDFHTLQSLSEKDVNTFENVSMKNIGLIDEIIPRYRSTYFNHIFSGGYSSGYYSYIWSGVLDTDAYQAFKETSLFDKATAKSFVDNILSKGGTGDPMEMYIKFRGREPSTEPLLRKRGLL